MNDSQVEKMGDNYQRTKNVESIVESIALQKQEFDCTHFFADIESAEQSKAAATVLCAVIGDVLGANIEFQPFQFVDLQHGGAVKNFLHSRRRPLGHYTDDGESTLALLSALVAEQGRANEATIVAEYCKAYSTKPLRGYGPMASRVLKMLSQHETTPDVSGRLAFPDGSYGNGCLMRASPLGVSAFLRGIDDTELRVEVLAATRCTHVHTEALSCTFVYCKLIKLACQLDVTKLDGVAELQGLVFASVSAGFDAESEPHMAKVIGALENQVDALLEANEKYIDGNNSNAEHRSEMRDLDRTFLLSIISKTEFGDFFAIRASEALAVAIYALLASVIVGPEAAIVKVVSFAGDADTVGCIAGALIGALHGHKFIPARWLKALEDRDEFYKKSLQLVQSVKE